MTTPRIKYIPYLFALVGTMFLLAIPVAANQPDSSRFIPNASPWLIADPSVVTQQIEITYLAPQGVYHNPPPHASIYDLSSQAGKARRC